MTVLTVQEVSRRSGLREPTLRFTTRSQHRRSREEEVDTLQVLAYEVPILEAEAYAPGVASQETLVADETRMCADARRNLARVLEAARELFASEGGGVSMQAIARRAGVGVGTIYRRFPTKKALTEAVVADHLGEVYREAVAAADAVTVEEQFCAAVTALVDRASTHTDLRETPAAAGLDFDALAPPAFLEMREFVATLLERAQVAGSIRTDVTVNDVLGLASGACMAGFEHGASSPTHLIAFALDGLRTRASRA